MLGRWQLEFLMCRLGTITVQPCMRVLIKDTLSGKINNIREKDKYFQIVSVFIGTICDLYYLW